MPFNDLLTLKNEERVNKQINSGIKRHSLSEDGWSRGGPRQFHDLRFGEDLREGKSKKIPTLLQT